MVASWSPTKILSRHLGLLVSAHIEELPIDRTLFHGSKLQCSGIMMRQGWAALVQKRAEEMLQSAIVICCPGNGRNSFKLMEHTQIMLSGNLDYLRITNSVPMSRTELMK
ncbi:hypothetical protein KIN20_036642 [Parelaphostrongylus tenuis]|uniref:Uncharacterized protein n=1 Tax=Parelaphostrongylus tenuis TaxID=148309 RepID=A0AAD5RD47_PARTN|nr:hypothetical protein KIN20_036642 [Parelaphostrongylus tenuis]